MVGQAVTAAAAADMLRIPFHDLIEEAHAAVVGIFLSIQGAV